MNKVLITGMEIGNEIDLCGGCSSLDFTWLLKMRNSKEKYLKIQK